MRWMKFFQLLVCGILGLFVTSLANAQASAVAKVNGVIIPQARLDMMVKAGVAQGQQDGPELRKAFRENLITEEIIAQEAIKKGLDKDPEIQTQLDLARQRVLVGAFQTDYIKKNSVSDETLRKEYEILKLQMGDKEYKAQHILVDNENEARDIIASLKKGADFGKLASERSKDEGSKNNGGNLDWSPSAAYVRPFAEALEKLQKGKMSEVPVHTSFGWHVIKLDDVRPIQVPPFEEAKQNLQQRILQREFGEVVQELRGNAKVE